MNHDNQISYLPIGFLRLPQIIGNPKANPPIPPLIPVSRATFWKWVATGKAPKPVKLGPKISTWRVEDIQVFIRGFGDNNADKN